MNQMPSLKLGWIDIVVYIIYLAFFGLGIVAGTHNTLWSVALCLSAGCLVLWFIARWQLGEAFSVGAEARKLVRRGLYSKIRHPIYVFGTLAFLFIVLALQGWLALIIWLVVILIQVRRVKSEELVLAETFGEEYAIYRSGTWF
jgi:protein-S-isoprenylcysteine O-methyltransferase Ste14